MKNVWTEKNVSKRYNELINLIEPEMERNQKRWNSSYDVWKKECDDLKDYLDKRRQYLINHTKSYFGLSSEEVKKYFG